MMKRVYKPLEIQGIECRVCKLNILNEKFDAHVERHRGFSERRSRVAEIKEAATQGLLWFGEPAVELLTRLHV